MSEMIERIARAIYVADSHPYTPSWEEAAANSNVELYFDMAHAAIQAMRDLPDDILNAACAANPQRPYGIDTTLREIVLAEHHAMIDACLKE